MIFKTMKTNPTIFIADDDLEDITLLRESLIERNAMVNCLTFHNGLVLINFLLTNTETVPDLITLDINMPIKNGFLTLHELKQNPLLKSIPVIMLSTSKRPEDAARSLQMGCLSFFTKPTSVSEYTTIAERILLLC